MSLFTSFIFIIRGWTRLQNKGLPLFMSCSHFTRRKYESEERGRVFSQNKTKVNKYFNNSFLL